MSLGACLIYKQHLSSSAALAFVLAMRVANQDVDVDPVADDSASLGSTPTLSSMSLDHEDDLFDDPEFTRMHFEGIERGEAEMQAQNEAFRELSIAVPSIFVWLTHFLEGMLTSAQTIQIVVEHIIDYWLDACQQYAMRLNLQNLNSPIEFTWERHRDRLPRTVARRDETLSTVSLSLLSVHWVLELLDVEWIGVQARKGSRACLFSPFTWGLSGGSCFPLVARLNPWKPVLSETIQVFQGRIAVNPWGHLAGLMLAMLVLKCTWSALFLSILLLLLLLFLSLLSLSFPFLRLGSH